MSRTRVGLYNLPVAQSFVIKILEESREHFRLPAVVVMAMNSESIYLQEIRGPRVYDRPEPASLDDYFHIGSCSKTVLAIVAAKLVELGSISWTTRFFDLFPELQEAADAAYKHITLEDLFLCQAGIQAITDS